MEFDIVNQIRAYKERYDGEVILTRKGQNFTTHGVIELIDKYWRSEFLNGDSDEDGIYKFFYNLVKFPTRVSTHRTDFDTKDIRAIAEDGQSYVPVYFLNKELKAWTKDQNIGSLLNELSAKLPRYGNVVFKVSPNGETKTVLLKNLSSDPLVPELKDSYCVVERHFMTPKELRDEKEWDKNGVQELIKDLARQNSKSRVIVDEALIYGPRGYFEDSKDEELVLGRVIVGDLDKVVTDQKGDIKADYSKVLFKSEVDNSPYYEFFWEEFVGTWLREGVVMELLEDQMKVNEVTNLQGKGFHWTSKKLYQTRDMGVARNLFYGVRNGDVLRVNSEITPIANEERNLASYREEIQQREDSARRNTFSFEAVTGESMPSGTPFRLGVIQQQAAGGYFDQKRENVGLMLKRLIVDVIIPTFKKQKRKAHLFNLYGEDSEFSNIEALYIESQLYRALENFAQTSGIIPSEEEINAERQRLQAKYQAKPREISIPDNFYDDMKYKVDIVVANESMALDAKNNALVTLLQTLGTNPAILQNDILKRIVFKMMDYAGISPEEFRMVGQQVATPMAQTFSPPPAAQRPELQSVTQGLTL